MYAFTIIFETAALTVELKVLWAKIGYLGGLITPLFYLLFVLRFVGNDKLLRKKPILLFSIVPVTVYILTLTNEYHHLIWNGYSEISPKTNLMEYYHGVGFWIGNVAYSYFLFVLASIYLIKFMVKEKVKFKAKLVLIASLFPWVASLFYITGFNFVPGFDLVPFAMILTGALLTYSIFNETICYL
ncbi:MAG: histidine kinase N-terminal 7TM domain-containing protein [Bacteroidales bacterium]